MKPPTHAGLVVAMLLVGCYGSTEPASNVGQDSATLNARGTANSGPATSHFELTSTFEPAGRVTPTRSWPAGASGPITETVTDLLVATDYSFRLCGSDQGGSAVCAQTRTFKTQTPAGDYVTGYYINQEGSDLTAGVRLNARSGPAGQDAHGTADLLFNGAPRRGTVTCMAVAGNRAVIGTDLEGPFENARILVVKGSPDAVDIVPTDSSPPQCGAAPAPFTDPTRLRSALIVHDAP